jgi:hypothetical protein
VSSAIRSGLGIFPVTLMFLARRFVQDKGVRPCRCRPAIRSLSVPPPCPRGLDGGLHPVPERTPRAIGAPVMDARAAAFGMAQICAMFHV